MKEGHKEAFTELPEDARVKIEHEPNKKVERVDYSSGDILDKTIAGTNRDPFVNVRDPYDIKEDLEKAKAGLKTAGEKAKDSLEKNASFLDRKVITPIKGLFATKEKRLTTFSVLGAILVGIFLLFIPVIFGNKNVRDPLAINPETGYTNRETDWNRFTNMMRERIYELSAPDRTQPQQAVLDYFELMRNSYRGTAQRMDINVLEAEYYLNMGLNADAMSAMLAIDTDYKQPADGDPDLPSYFARFANYYKVLIKVSEANGYESMSNEANQKLEALNAERDRALGGK